MALQTSLVLLVASIAAYMAAASAAAAPPPPCPPACLPACQPECVSGGATITLTASADAVATTKSEYIGLTLDYANICNRTANHSVIGTCIGATDLPLSPHLAHLASMNPSGVSPPRPGLLRIGGSLQDSVLFLGEGESCPVNVSRSRFASTASPGYQCSQDDPNGKYGRCFTTERMEELCKFASASHLKLVIGLNACMGRNAIDAPMNLTMLEPFLRFVAGCEACKGSIWGFELGNELDTHVYHNCDGVEPEALGADMQGLAMLNTKLFAAWPAADRPNHAGPDIAAFTGTTAMPDEDEAAGTNYYSRYLNATKHGALSAMTFHQYTYCDRGSDIPGLDTVIDLDCLARMKLAGTSLKAVTNAYSRDLELWVGESSNEWTGGLPNRSDVTFDAFFYADQLQTMANANVSAVVRQDLLGMYYQLLSYPELRPKPSYWVAFMWKLLVGRDVFGVSESSPLPVPVWMHGSVHCGLRAGVARTAFLINFHMTSSARIALSVPSLAPPSPVSGQQAGAAAASGGGANLTAFVLRGPVFSDRLTVNGQPLELKADGTLPLPAGVPVGSGGVLELPPYSIAFLELAGERTCV